MNDEREEGHSMTGKEMWRRFCAETGLDPKTPYEAWAFCGGGPFTDELAALVLSGTKTATASAFVKSMNDWFTIDSIDESTYIISEYWHWEETHCYLLIGSDRALLIDTGLGICNICEQVGKLTAKHYCCCYPCSLGSHRRS